MSINNTPVSTRPEWVDRTPKIVDLIPTFMDSCADRVRTKQSREGYRSLLMAMSQDVRTPVCRITEDQVVKWLRGDGTLSPNWLLNRRSKMIRFFGWAHAEGFCPTNPAIRLRTLVDPPKRCVRAGNWLTAAQAMAVLEQCPDTVLGRRDRFALALLVLTGLRASEAVALRWGDIDTTRGQSSVVGKGEKPALVPITPQLVEEIERWLDGRTPSSTDPVLCRAASGWGDEGREHWLMWDKPICTATLRRITEMASERAGREFRPHDMRRTLAGVLDESGMPIDAIAAVLRHNSTATTQRYLQSNPRRGVEAMREFRM